MIFREARLRFRELVLALQPGMLAFETPATRNRRSARLQFGIAAQIEEIAAELGIFVGEQQPATIKKWATGNGNASKEEMMQAARARGLPFMTDDEADAQLLLDYYVETTVRGVA